MTPEVCSCDKAYSGGRAQGTNPGRLAPELVVLILRVYGCIKCRLYLELSLLQALDMVNFQLSK